ncbi:glutathione S-transferase family protein [Tateyamaria omphalii]|uniref:Glutathione S-transferase n=1 Tax=Tateyamaria omphalii TaxID=299262 RepID=A0A1P8MTQ5_9RHOB|nr:glutathione S-transferase family protein [Tateyamaria omphalii]APX11470.1 glutathione S-transferase [Tateyamaria omphalii]
MLTLYFAPRSRAVRVAWLLDEMGLDYDLVSYDLGDPEMRSAEFRTQVHPMGRVPVLVDDDVQVIESGAILEYLLTRHGDGRFRPAPDSADYPAYLQWLHYAEGMIMPQVNSYMVETFFLPPERRSEVHAARAKKLIGQMLVPVDAALDGQDYLAGDFSAADIMTGSAAISAKGIGIDFGGMPNLAAYMDRLAHRAAYRSAAAL